MDGLADIDKKIGFLEDQIARNPQAGNMKEAMGYLTYLNNRRSQALQDQMQMKKMEMLEKEDMRVSEAHNAQMEERKFNLGAKQTEMKQAKDQELKKRGFSTLYNNVFTGSDGQRVAVPTYGQGMKPGYQTALSKYIMEGGAAPSPEQYQVSMPSLKPGDYANKGQAEEALQGLNYLTPYTEQQAGQMKSAADVLGGVYNRFAGAERDAAVDKILQGNPQSAGDYAKIAGDLTRAGAPKELADVYKEYAKGLLESDTKIRMAGMKPEGTPTSRYSPEERSYIFAKITEKEDDGFGNMINVQRNPTREEMNQRSLEISGKPLFLETAAGGSGGSGARMTESGSGSRQDAGSTEAGSAAEVSEDDFAGLEKAAGRKATPELIIANRGKLEKKLGKKGYAQLLKLSKKKYGDKSGN